MEPPKAESTFNFTKQEKRSILGRTFRSTFKRVEKSNGMVSLLNKADTSSFSLLFLVCRRVA